jgi:phage shock protein E
MSQRILVAVLALFAAPVLAEEIANPLIDYDAFEKQVAEVRELRKQRRISEAQFMRMAREPGTVVLDARSAARFAQLHVQGAKNLSLPDMTEEELARVIPAKTTRVLIYCNNNFLNEPVAFPSKALPASLNVHTFNVLHSYGYTNIYELGPLIDIRKSKLEFAGSRQAQAVASRSR